MFNFKFFLKQKFIIIMLMEVNCFKNNHNTQIGSLSQIILLELLEYYILNVFECIISEVSVSEKKIP